MSNGLKYKEIASIESFGDRSVGISISFAASFNITEEDQWWVREQCQSILKHLEHEAVKRDPKVIASIAQEKKDLLACFDGPIHARAVKNEYGEQPHFPWFKVTTQRGVIKIGWRRRVINIDWSESDIKGQSRDLFPNEDVTREDRYIHAWNYEKAKSYIDTLMGAI